MSIQWSKDRIELLSTAEVQSLRENALAKGYPDVASTCDEVLSTRKPIRKSGVSRSSSPTKALEADCAKKLSDLAAYLTSKYDLSSETATKMSDGIKGFRAHQVTAKNGQAKLGGDQRIGKVAIDRYISYRVGNEPVALTALLISQESEDGLLWQVLGSEKHFQKSETYSQLRSYASDDDGGLYKCGLNFTSFSEAATLFEEIISKLTKPISA
jgi:hypothetical protein